MNHQNTSSKDVLYHLLAVFLKPVFLLVNSSGQNHQSAEYMLPSLDQWHKLDDLQDFCHHLQCKPTEFLCKVS
uniref:Uncharacterized protein n=2 Tax=Picea TaxID=3328 RepID=A0A124GN25_PICGL|nr:hypothetical protein ABT39_MTgene5667 [Picea glauca]QHR90276.1 hypothetical protein Q903MT_gene4299 [Picea sitchensis]